MTSRILAGLETEYGLYLEGRGAEHQVEDATALVRSYPGECFVGWDYRFESPRADLRGFNLKRLAVDPEDAKFDRPSRATDHDVRSDRVLPNGARFYNDHGHPEYATPECESLAELADHDLAGMAVVRAAARAVSEKTGIAARCYRNNTDFHGASYGTHESYLVPRSLGFDGLYAAVTPMLIARQILTGAGKVGSEHGAACDFQISQRADFFVETANAETLYRRPIFNTRDEPHADPRAWIRLHVIAGDATMIGSATALKVGLVKLALALANEGAAQEWRIKDPVRAFQAISRDATLGFRVELAGGSWTTADEILEGAFSAAEAQIDLDDDLRWTIDRARTLLIQMRSDFEGFARHVDWAAKRRMIEQYIESEGSSWRDPALQSLDLEYHNLEPEDSLHDALEQMDAVERNPSEAELLPRLRRVCEPTRARARGLAVQKFGPFLRNASWRMLTFEIEGELIEVELSPDAEYPEELETIENVGTFIQAIKERMR